MYELVCNKNTYKIYIFINRFAIGTVGIKIMHCHLPTVRNFPTQAPQF